MVGLNTRLVFLSVRYAWATTDTAWQVCCAMSPYIALTSPYVACCSRTRLNVPVSQAMPEMWLQASANDRRSRGKAVRWASVGASVRAIVRMLILLFYHIGSIGCSTQASEVTPIPPHA